MQTFMSGQEYRDFDRIAEAIRYIRQNFSSQPDLDEISKNMHMSPFHFQRMFTEWAGVSPKKFLQYTSIQYAKHALRNHQSTLFETSQDLGLSGTSRLHDLFIRIEGMTPGEYKNEGIHLEIQYAFSKSPFGEILIAATRKGICHLAFIENKQISLNELHTSFPKAHFNSGLNAGMQKVIDFFNRNLRPVDPIHLHLKASPFQLKVWEALLKIPSGRLSTYGEVAKTMKREGSARAVGNAVGSNPVAFLIPCHRVIQSTGRIGGYMWDPIRKTAMIGWEAAQLNPDGIG
ncbi:MAG TPA: bifunctional helix-turn-helix domain-containing protein/methylated-DNA--[protein]-cysteine S-methyltransferase [Saprospiraceae bacterium]|nr:bifunctional helix-turn-helix domain-containing protein/methylated-DNA--[protein]-cysteine S-methyltransferase [Saprospiraceae bacterium]